MEWIRSVLEALGQLVDSDPAVRGGVVAGTVIAALLGGSYSLIRKVRGGRREAADPPARVERVKVTIDAPEGQTVEFRSQQSRVSLPDGSSGT